MAVGRLVAVVAVAVTLAFGWDPLVPVVALFLVVVPFERIFPRHRQKLLRPELGTDLAYAVLAGPIKAAGLGVGLVLAALSLSWLPGLALRPAVTALPGPARLLLGFVLFDALAYWAHRWMHRVPLLWRFHVIHHSSQRLDWVAGFRTHPLDGVLLAPVFAVLVVAGFDPELTGGLLVVQVVAGFFLHANVRWRLRPLHRVVATPEFHHWHHSSDPQAMDSNFAAFLPVWDVLFGTWFMPAGRRPDGYGVTEPIPAGLVAQVLFPLRGGVGALRRLRHPATAFRQGRAGLAVVLGQIRAASRRPAAGGR